MEEEEGEEEDEQKPKDEVEIRGEEKGGEGGGVRHLPLNQIVGGASMEKISLLGAGWLVGLRLRPPPFPQNEG